MGFEPYPALRQGVQPFKNKVPIETFNVPMGTSIVPLEIFFVPMGSLYFEHCSHGNFVFKALFLWEQ